MPVKERLFSSCYIQAAPSAVNRGKAAATRFTQPGDGKWVLIFTGSSYIQTVVAQPITTRVSPSLGMEKWVIINRLHARPNWSFDQREAERGSRLFLVPGEGYPFRCGDWLAYATRPLGVSLLRLAAED